MRENMSKLEVLPGISDQYVDFTRPWIAVF